jgi:polyisoprenoid-binding protein YceI
VPSGRRSAGTSERGARADATARAGVGWTTWRALALAALVGALGPSPAWPATFKVDPAQSSLLVRLFKDGPAAKLGHDHVVEARAFSGTLTHDPGDPTASAIRLDVDVAALVADDPATRRRLGLAGELSASERTEVDAAMKGEGQLAAARFPSMTFASSAIARQADGRYAVTGKLTIRGVTNEVRFPAELRLDGGKLRGRAELRFTQSSFGYRPYRAFLGAIRNQDEVVLQVDLVAAPSR